MGGLFDISNLNIRLEELESIINNENFWKDVENSQVINKEYNDIKKIIDEFNSLNDEIETVLLLKEELSLSDYNNECDNINKKLIELDRRTHLNGEYDNLNCYIEIHPGAGGTESCDWASMILRMYERFCEKYNYKYEILNLIPGEEAGIKSVLMHVNGEYSYGILKRESGVHRLVRISPFDANKRRHTSFASVIVTPEFLNNKEIEIKESDLKIDVFHSSGAGGQSVNTSNSAVRITHIPTGIVISCQNERSQLKNKEIAINILKNKLYELKIKEEEEQKNNLKDTSREINFGSQIRNYVLEPYKLVKDLRSGFESNEPLKILDGEILDLLNYNITNIK